MNERKRTRTSGSAATQRRGGPEWLAALALVGAIVSSAATAGASDLGRCERLYSRALAALHAGDDAEAASLFDEAVAADPKDMFARFYRGVAHGHAHRYEQAVEDLQAVVTNNPAIERADLELGYALYRLARYDEAAVALERAKARPSTQAEAAFVGGMNDLRRNQARAARASLDGAILDDAPAAIAARYYRGLAAYRQGDEEAARRDFEFVVERSPETAVGREARAFLARLDEPVESPLRLHVGSAFEYDSNVALAPDDEALASTLFRISDRDDGRAVITAGAGYSPYVTAATHFSIGYDFLQSLHFDLSEFDLQTHKAVAQLALYRGDATIGLTGDYGWSLLDGDSFVGIASGTPWIRIEEEGLGRTEFYYRARYRSFQQDPFDDRRDGSNHAVGGRQIFDLGAPGRTFAVGYRFDVDRAAHGSGERFDYIGHQFETGLGWPLASSLSADLVYAYKLEDYDGGGSRRDDDEHHLILRLDQRLSRLLWLTAGYTMRINGSDRDPFDYDRHVTSIALEGRY